MSADHPGMAPEPAPAPEPATAPQLVGAPEPAPAAASDVVSWEVSGPPGAPPIVFVHGAMMGRSVWRPQIDALSDRYRCISVDQPGHGTLKDSKFTIEMAVANVVEAIDREAGGRAVVVGLSLGGYVSMQVAGRHPARVRGLVIAGSTREPEGVSRLAFALYGHGLRLAPEPWVRAVALAWFRRRYGPAVAAAITAGGHFARGGSWAVRQLAGARAGGRFRDRLLAYGGPILVINGSFDLVFRIGAGRFLSGVPGVRQHMIPRAGHLSNVDKPEAFTSLVEEFIATLPD